MVEANLQIFDCDLGKPRAHQREPKGLYKM